MPLRLGPPPPHPSRVNAPIGRQAFWGMSLPGGDTLQLDYRELIAARSPALAGRFPPLSAVIIPLMGLVMG